MAPLCLAAIGVILYQYRYIYTEVMGTQDLATSCRTSA
jgi:hypothetical protein